MSAFPPTPVQLTELLRRLSQEERAEVLRRYGASEFDLADTAALAAALSPPATEVLAFMSPLRFSDQFRGIWAGHLEQAWSQARYFAFATGTTAEGETAVMVPEHAQRALRWAPDQGAAEALAPWDASWTVQSDCSVLVGPNCHPDALRELWEIAALESNQGAAVFRITPAALARALNRGLTPEVITKRLVRWSGREVPATVARLLRDQGGH